MWHFLLFSSEFHVFQFLGSIYRNKMRGKNSQRVNLALDLRHPRFLVIQVRNYKISCAMLDAFFPVCPKIY